MADNVLNINGENFEKDVLKSDVPVLVDFWAEWCMPCKMIAPAIGELASEYKGKIKVGKIDIDNNAELATNLQILSIPTLILYKKGNEVKRIVGVNPKEAIKSEIESVLR